MLKIENITAFSTGLSKEFKSINSIQIENKPFGEGGFGEVYHCIQVNGHPTAIRQVIKIFKNNGKGSAQRGFETIQKLQQKLKDKNIELLQKKKQSLSNLYPALLGVPQFSFSGDLKGRKVMGYSAHNLVDMGFTEFKEILEKPQLNRQYQFIPIKDKMLIAYNLVAAFNLLKQLLYIHADFKAEALFVNLKELKCAIIDYDSGAVIINPNDKPSTWGTQQDWLAPEIMQQLSQFANNQGTVKVDLWSDMWSVIIGVHYLLFTCHPLFYLKEISKRSITAYFNQYQWPDVDPSFNYFSGSFQKTYPNYKEFIAKRLPKNVRGKLAYSINQGYSKPSARVSYGALETVLKTTQGPPQIVLFQASKSVFQGTTPVTLSWKTEQAGMLSLNGQTVASSGSLRVSPLAETSYVLKAQNNFGKLQKKVTIGIQDQAPQVHQFSADKVTRNDTQPLRLNWQVSNAQRIFIDQSIGEVTNKTQITVAPIKETTYTLTAINFFGTKSSKTLKIEVSQKPPSIIFQANPLLISAGMSTELFWEVAGATAIEIQPSLSNVASKGKRSISLSKDTQFTLRAISFFGIQTEASIHIQVIEEIKLNINTQLNIPRPKLQLNTDLNIIIPNINLPKK